MASGSGVPTVRSRTPRAGPHSPCGCRTYPCSPHWRPGSGAMAALVFDIGGTKTRAGVFEAGALVRTACAPTPNHLQYPTAPFDSLREALLSLLGKLANEP